MLSTDAAPAVDVKIARYEKIGRSPAVPLIPRAWLELLDAGLMERTHIPVFSGSPVVVALAPSGAAVGFLHWYAQDDGQAWVVLGWIDPTWRRRGIYRRLYADLREQCLAQGIPAISGGTDAGNAGMLATAAALGRKVTGAIYRDELAAAPIAGGNVNFPPRRLIAADDAGGGP